VEINNSFYRLPERATFDHWHAQTPPGFAFAVKAPQGITHRKKLKECTDTLQRFLEHAAALEEKLAVILFQLPPRGPAGPYAGSYSAARLRTWGERLRGWQGQGRSVWVFFDNDEAGHAVKNARLLCRLVEPGLRRAVR